MSDYTPTWNYPALVPGVEYAPNREVLDWTVRWPAWQAEEFPRVPVGVGPDGMPVLVDLRGPHVVCTGTDREAFLRTVLVGLADRFSPDLVQFLVTDFDDALGPMRLVPHAATTALGLDTRPEKASRLARAIEWEVWRRANLTEHDLAREPALVLALADVDRLLAERPELRHVLSTVDGRLRMHLLMTAVDPSGIPVLTVSVVDGYGSIGAQRFRLTPYSPDQLSEFAATFMYYNHPAHSLWKPPGTVTYERMMALDQGGDGVPIGVLDDGDFTTLRHDFSRKSHLVIRADPGCGKTTALRTVLRGLAATDAVVLGLDQVTPVVGRIRTLLVRRSAAPESWDGPELFIVADDYDRVTAGANPLGPLEDLLRHGSSIGVHVIVTTTGDVSTLPVIPALPDSVTLLPTDPELPRFRWDTPASRFGMRQAEPLFARPRGRAFYGANHPEVQIAIDTAPPRLEFRPVDDLFAGDTLTTAENLVAVIGATDGDVPVKLDLRQHTWCGGDFGMGKTTLLRRIAYSVAARYTPGIVHLLVADADRLGDVARLPHTTAHVSDAHRLTTLLDDELRRRLVLEAEGRLAETPHLVALVDEAGLFVAMVPAMLDTFRRVAAVGERVGMSLVLTARSSMPADLDELMAVRVTLPYHGENSEARTLGVPAITSRRHAGPGAGYIREGDGRPRSFMLTDVTPEEVRAARFQVRRPAVRALPLSPPLGTLTYDELAHIVATQPVGGVPLGLDGQEPVAIDVERHVIVTGRPGSGRSTVLRTLLRGIARRYTAADCAVLLLHDNMVAGVLPEEHVLATSPGFEPTMLDEVLTALRKRVGNPQWTGPRLFVAVDDLDRFPHHPLTAMGEILPHVNEIGLSFLITGTRDILDHSEISALDATRLHLSEDSLSESRTGDIPALPAVGHATLGDRRVRLPWYQPVTYVPAP